MIKELAEIKKEVENAASKIFSALSLMADFIKLSRLEKKESRKFAMQQAGQEPRSSLKTSGFLANTHNPYDPIETFGSIPNVTSKPKEVPANSTQHSYKPLFSKPKIVDTPLTLQEARKSRMERWTGSPSSGTALPILPRKKGHSIK